MATVVAVATWELEVYDSQSLKDKRRVVRSLKDRLREKFNLSVIESGHQDAWQRAEITAALAAANRAQADSILEKADSLVESEHRARVIRADREYV